MGESIAAPNTHGRRLVHPSIGPIPHRGQSTTWREAVDEFARIVGLDRVVEAVGTPAGQGD